MAENRKFSHTGWVIVSVTKNDGSLRENPNLSERVGSSVYNRWGGNTQRKSLLLKISMSVSTEDIDKEISEDQREYSDVRYAYKYHWVIEDSWEIKQERFRYQTDAIQGYVLHHYDSKDAH